MTRDALINEFVKTIETWQQVTSEPHRYGGTEFKFGKVEIGHIHHGNGMVDIPFTVKIREALVTEGLANVHHLLEDSGWITVFVRDDSSLKNALWLMRLSYLQKTSRRLGVDESEITKLNLTESVKAVAFPKLA